MKSITTIMKVAGIFLTLAQPIVSAALADALASASDMPYPVQALQYRHEIDGQTVELTGNDVRDVMGQMQSLHPGFDAKAFPEDPTLSLDRHAKNGVMCWPVRGQNWAQAFSSGANVGITDLLSMGRLQVKARSCVRIACWDVAGIYFCNDLHVQVNPALAYLATYAIEIMDNCMDANSLVAGQAFDSDGYNVIVRLDKCPIENIIVPDGSMYVQT